jgi:two-component system OmpR family response regulator
MRLLLVEDDPMVGAAAADCLRAEGYAIDWARDGQQAASLLDAPGVYDLVLLDLGLPKRDGLSLLRDLRARRHRVPVLVATARDAVADRVAGLDAGADDYVVKPYDPEELLARVRALLRRASGHAEPVFMHGAVSVNPQTREALVDGQPIMLTAREWAVLQPLIARPGAIFSRAQLEEKLYGWDDDIASNAVEVYVHGLRKKLGHDFIQTVRGVGYVVPK